MATNSGSSSDSKALDALRGRVAGFAEERLGELAVERGWLAEAALDGAIDMIERGASSAPLLSLLVDLKLLTRVQVDELRGRLPAIEVEELAAPREPDLPMEVRLAREDPGSRFGKFVLVQEVGHGGMGTVWRAWQSDLGRWVAVKRLHPEATKFLPRFLREGRLGAQIVHPNLVPIHEVGEIDGTPYLAMALIDGGSLEGRRLPIRQAVEIAMAVAYAAHELHGVGIVHRDIKPGNIMIDRSGRAYLGDFSLACTEETAPGVSKSGLMLGTPAYAAPEQIRGERSRTGPRSDVYSLGATLYTLLTGEMPFTGADSFEIVSKALRGEPPPLRARRPEVNHQIQDIVWTAMRKEPEERYATALEFATDLKRYLDGETVHARPPGMVSRLGWTLTRHRRVLVAGVALAVLAAATAAGQQLRASWRRQASAAALGRAERSIDGAGRMLERGPAAAGEAHRALDEAMRPIDEALAAEPQSPRAHFARGKVEAMRGRLAAAEASYGEALRLDPADRRARFERGRVRLERALTLLLASGVRPYTVPCCVLSATATIPAVAWHASDVWEHARALHDAAREDLAGGDGPFASPELASAYRALLHRRLQEAEEICDRQMREGIPEPEFHVIRGLVHLLSDQRAQAHAEFSRLTDRRRAYALGYLARAVAAPSIEDALADVDLAIAMAPGAGVVHLNRAALRLQAGNADGASADLDRALALEPEWPAVREVRVLARLLTRRFDDAEAEAQALGGSARGSWARALVRLARDGHDDRTLAILDQALAADPAHVPSLAVRRHLHVRAGRWTAAHRDTDQILKDPMAPAWWRGFRAEILLLEGRHQEAKEEFDESLKGRYRDPWCLAQRSVALVRLGRVDEAIRDCDEAIRIHPRAAFAWFQRAACGIVTGRWENVVADFERGAALGEPDPHNRRDYAAALARLGRFEESLAQYARLTAAEDVLAEVLADQAEVFQLAGRAADGLPFAQLAVEKDPRRWQHFFVRAKILLDLGRRAEAGADLDRAVALEPSIAELAAALRGK